MIKFEQFYFAVHGRSPFAWQRRLAQQVASEGWPDDWVVKLPTASGKTSLLDIAVFALAAQAGRATRERTAPLRTFFVVDRRLVVDDVSRHAERLRSALTTIDSQVISEVKQRLLKFGSGCPLQVATLRGGMYRSDTWADLPNQPLICVSTVDQVGSRLLFRGYGVSGKRRSVDAALVGCDSLIIVDEAHLSEPFLQTMRSVRKYAGWGEYQLPQARLIEMSATAKGKVGFALGEEDYDDQALAPRLNAEKIAELREAADLEEEAAAAARRLAAGPMTNVVGVVLNTVNGARAVFERLRNGNDQAVLLTGRIRPFDRGLLVDKFLQRIKAGRDRGKDRRLFVVATQTIEVGADLDFDALVTEAAALDALRQRFGRLDRLGELKSTKAVILRRKRRKGEVDRIYGEAADNAWDWLNARAQDDEGRRGLIDFGARRMTELYEREKPEGVNTNPGRAPILTPAHIETWIQTYPTPYPDPEVAPFLHGLEATSADVNLVWRADLDHPLESWVDIVQSAPPLTTEALPIPIWVASSWLREQPPVQASDLEGAEEPSEEQKSLERETGLRDFLIWRGPEDSRIGKVGDIRPGDTLLVRSDEGGADDYGWNPRSTSPVRDIGNECTTQRADEAGGRYTVRVHPKVLFPPGEVQEEGYAENRETLRHHLEQWRTEEDEEAKEAIIDLVQRIAPQPRRSDWIDSAVSGDVFFRTRWMKPINGERPSGVFVEETGEDDTSSLTVFVPLDTHVSGVTETVCRFAAGCGVDSEIAEGLRRAAEIHDLGKCDERFQMMLDPAGENEELLAKGKSASSKPEYERRRRLAGYPRGARHEIWSVALAERAPGLIDDAARDLILYLVGTHHGHGRPFVPVWHEEEDVIVTAEREGLRAHAADVKELCRFGSGWVDRFWSLHRKYGYWGLAYLEAILRRADCVQSRKEEAKANDRH